MQTFGWVRERKLILRNKQKMSSICVCCKSLIVHYIILSHKLFLTMKPTVKHFMVYKTGIPNQPFPGQGDKWGVKKNHNTGETSQPEDTNAGKCSASNNIGQGISRRNIKGQGHNAYTVETIEVKVVKPQWKRQVQVRSSPSNNKGQGYNSNLFVCLSFKG